MMSYYYKPLTLLLVFLISSASYSDSADQRKPAVAKPAVAKPAVAKQPTQKKISMSEFKNLQMRLNKFNKLSEQEKKARIHILEARENYSVAKKNFRIVLDLKILVKDIQKNENCYVKYYRLKDINKKIKRIPSDEDLLVLRDMKKPIQKFLKQCGSLRLDLLKKYKELKK